jgi:uncharacterized protein YnzC (UPF0291/DUF896 family)
MPQTDLPNYEAAIVSRITAPHQPELTPAAAEAILVIGFSQDDHDRMNTLASTARERHLTAEEQAEVEAYSRVGSLLGVLKSRARRALKGRIATTPVAAD